MNVMTVIAHPNPKSLCHAILRQFDAGLRAAGRKAPSRAGTMLGGRSSYPCSNLLI